jgi:hypothetical protein
MQFLRNLVHRYLQLATRLRQPLAAPRAFSFSRFGVSCLGFAVQVFGFVAHI